MRCNKLGNLHFKKYLEMHNAIGLDQIIFNFIFDGKIQPNKLLIKIMQT